MKYSARSRYLAGLISGNAGSGVLLISLRTSSYGDDDIYVFDGSYVTVYDITSPDGSIGIRYRKNYTGCVAEFAENVTPNPKPFFANNEGFEIGLETRKKTNANSTDVQQLVMTKSNTTASIFGEGSLAMIVSLVALIASVAALVVNVSAQKKAVPATANNQAKKNTDEE